MGWIVVNTFTDSPVSHTESSLGVEPYDMVWETEKEARRHAYNLTVEYSFTHPELEPHKRFWIAKPATPEQVERAKVVAAFGKDYADEIAAGQARQGVDPAKIRRNMPGGRIPGERNPLTGEKL